MSIDGATIAAITIAAVMIAIVMVQPMVTAFARLLVRKKTARSFAVARGPPASRDTRAPHSLPIDPDLDWFYAENDTSRGPYKVSDFAQLLRDGMVGPQTPVWSSPFGANWKSAQEAGLLGSVPLPPPAPPSRVVQRRRKWIRVVLITVLVFWLVGGGLWVMEFFGVDTATMLSDDFPKCSSQTAKDLAKQAIEGAPAAKLVNVAVFGVQDASEVGYDSVSEKRSCKAVALLNSGRRDIRFGQTIVRNREGADLNLAEV